MRSGVALECYNGKDFLNMKIKKAIESMDTKKIKTIGYVLSVLGFGISMVQGWIEEKKQTDEISKQVKEMVEKELKNGK